MFLLRALFSISFSLLVVAYMNYLVENAPEGQAATVISLFEVTLRGGVGLVAAPLAGLLFDWAGAYWLYAIGMVGSLLALLILQVVTASARESKPEGSTVHDPSA
jgi:MFS family permease